MKIEWRRGFFRAWMVLALAWVALVGWKERDQWSNGGLSYWPSEGECWDRLAKWPDGTPLAAPEEPLWIALADEYDIESNRVNNNWDWRANSIPERNRWRHIVRQKLEDCEAANLAAKPILQRWTLTVSESWSALKESLSLIFLPPLALLIVGWLLGWIVRGFRTTT